MFTSIKKVVFATVVAGLLACGQASATDEVSKKLLTDFWSTTKGKDTTAYYAGVENKSPESIYAFALVKTQQHDVKMALRAIEVLEGKDPENAKPLRLKVWLQLRQDKFDDAMGSLVKFVSLTIENTEPSDFIRQEASEFAGTVFGFLDGPVAYKVNSGNRNSAITQVLRKMSEQEQGFFDTGYSKVANKFNEMMSQKMQVDADAAAQDAVIQQEKYKSLAVREKQLHEAEQRTAKERASTRAQINKGLTDIARTDLAFANQQAFVTPHYRPYGHYVVHSSGSSKHHYKHHVVGVTFRRPTYLRSSYHDLQARRNILAGHYAQLRDLGAGQMNSLNKELKEITKAKNRTMNQKLRALKPSGKMVTKSVALKSKSRSILTYEEFPLEIERQLLLASTK